MEYPGKEKVMMVGIFRSKEKVFWDWFSSNITWLSEPEQENYDELLDKMLEELHRYCDNLYFEIGRKSADEMELIITAHGNIEYFDQVERLVNKASKFENWVITPFKPPMERNFIHEKNGISINTDSVYFDPLENENRPMDLGLMVYIEGFNKSKEDDFFNSLCIVLQTILGEKSYVSDIQHIEMNNLPPDYDKYISIKELPEFILWRKSKLNNI